MGRLLGTTVARVALCAKDVEAMFRLMTRYYLNVSMEIFLRDLVEKDQVILLRDVETYELKGFSTFMSFCVSASGELNRAIFSGDTIIDQEYWGEQELSRSFSRFLLSVSETSMEPAFWFLICKGYKTYRYLPLNFHQFYPRYDMATPPYEQAVLDEFSSFKFPSEYNREKGTISFSCASECLREGVADVTEAKMQNPHVRFFVKKNPGYRWGHELACIARLSCENFTKAFYRSALHKEKNSEADSVDNSQSGLGAGQPQGRLAV